MVEAKKNESANTLKEVKRLCKEFVYIAGMLKGPLAEGRKKSWKSHLIKYSILYCQNF